MTPFALLTFALCIIFASSVPTNDSNSRPTAIIESGIVAGTTTTLPTSTITVNKFLGIPFGAPPVRFSPPQPPAPWQSTYDASEYKPACIQKFNYPEASRNRIIEWVNTPGPPAGESEDCLNLNVFTPASATEGSKAVLFWIHGGAFSYGSGSLPLYDGSSFAANHDVVVVTINYRTNVFGFPGAPTLLENERNLGLLDQRLALEWVHRNIAAFGGDSDKITIMGESSGAGSVDALITAPPNPVPFHAAIMQSGQATIYASSEDSTASWNDLVEAVNCSSDNTLECIRAVPASMLRENMERLALDFGPVPDGGVTWAETPRQNRLNSTDNDLLVARVPVLIGSNADEGSIYSVGQNDTEAYLRASLPEGATYEVIQALLNAYSLGSPGISNEFERISSINTEFVFQCPVAVVAEESVEVNINAWRYYFNASFPNTQLFEGSGAYHAAEISAVFGTYPEEGATEFQMDVSRAMQKAWADFAKEPNRGPGWEMVPELGAFGNGATAEVDDNARREVFAVIDAEDVDGRCGLYQALYDVISYD